MHNLQQILELLRRQTRLAKDRRERPPRQLAVQWHDHDPSVVMSQLLMAATRTDDRKAGLQQGLHRLLPGDDRERAAHAGMRISTGATIGCDACTGGVSSKYSSSASLRLASASSTLWPWLATSTSRQRATYHSPSWVTTAVKWTTVASLMVLSAYQRCQTCQAQGGSDLGGRRSALDWTGRLRPVRLEATGDEVRRSYAVQRPAATCRSEVMVELRGLEPRTCCLQSSRSTT